LKGARRTVESKWLRKLNMKKKKQKSTVLKRRKNTGRSVRGGGGGAQKGGKWPVCRHGRDSNLPEQNPDTTLKERILSKLAGWESVLREEPYGKGPNPRFV